jgi:MFS family permease
MRLNPDSSLKDSSLWYGWIVLAVVFLVMSVMIGIRNSLGFFFKPIAGEFGWNRAETAGAYSIGMLVQSFCSPFFGRLGERWSLRWMTALGVFFGGAAFLIGSSINNLFRFYLMYGLLNFGFAASTFVPQVQILSNWFVKRRGLAMGVSNSGQGFAAVLILAIPFLIELIGWRHSYFVLAGFTLIFVFPLTALLIRDHPGDRRTVADAPFLSTLERASHVDRESKDRQPKDGTTVESAFWVRVFSLRFFLIAFTYGAIAFIMVGTTVHIVPHATDQGFAPKTSAFIFLLWGICLLGGNLVSILSDYLGRSPTYAIGATLGIGACTLFAFFVKGMPEELFYVGAALSGMGLGLTRPTASALLADHFAGPGFGKLNGSVMMIFGLFGALGAFLTGYLFDISGAYRSAFLLLAIVNLAGAATAVPLGRMQQRQTVRQ